MKKQLLVFILAMLSCHLQAQNYDLIRLNGENHFQAKTPPHLGSEDEFFTIRIDTTYSLSNNIAYRNHQIFFNNTALQYPCMGVLGDSSWIGDKIVLDTSGGERNYYFYSRPHATVGTYAMNIKPLAALNDNWIFTNLPNSEYIQATLSAVTTENVLGVLDSVKTIVLQAKNSSNANIPHPFNGREIKFSKNNGLVKIFNVFNFPTDTTVYRLVGASNPDRGIVNLTARAIYDYEVGDEFHTTTRDQTFLSSHTITNRKKIILTKNISQNQDTITYTYERCQTTVLQPQNSKTHIFDTLSEVIILSQLEHLNKLNNEPLQNGYVRFLPNTTYTVQKRQKEHILDFYYYNSSSNCWEEIIGTPGDFLCYADGLGGGYYRTVVSLFVERFHTLVYYKKGAEIWGTPIVCDTTNSVVQLKENQGEIKIFPNPFSNSTTISIEDFNATDNWNFELLDITGKQLFSIEIDEQNFAVHKNNLPAGMYIYRMRNNQKQQQYVGKLVVE